MRRGLVPGLAGADIRCGDWLGPTHGEGTDGVRHTLWASSQSPHRVCRPQPVPAPLGGFRQLGSRLSQQTWAGSVN